MTRESAEPAGFLETILRETIGQPTFEQGVSLIGALSQYRIVFSPNLTGRLRSQSESVILDPLEPQAAAALVAGLFGLDCDRLFLAYWNRWVELKESPATKGLIPSIHSHPCVDRLEPWSPP